MIFADRSVHEITEAEIEALVSDRQSERQDLEFKANIDLAAIDRDALCMEILEDIVSMANGGGGYIVVGINEERGTNRASGFFPLSESQAHKVHQAVSDWVLQHIAERLSGFELQVRNVAGCHWILLMHVPANARPHMVTFNHNTKFCIRHGDRKREMSIGEIRTAFTSDFVGLRLTGLEQGIRNVEARIATATTTTAESLSKQIVLARTADEAFHSRCAEFETQSERIFWIAAAPTELNNELLDLNSQTIRTLLESPPHQRYGGWNMTVMSSKVNFSATGELHRGNDGFGLRLHANGLLEFSAPLAFFNHDQDEEKFKSNPILYPYAVVEFPASFTRMYEAVSALFDPGRSIKFIVGFFNIKNAMLVAGHPESMIYGYAPFMRPPYKEQNLVLPPITEKARFHADEVAKKLVSGIYNRFDHPVDHIPFWSDTEARFEFA